MTGLEFSRETRYWTHVQSAQPPKIAAVLKALKRSTGKSCTLQNAGSMIRSLIGRAACIARGPADDYKRYLLNVGVLLEEVDVDGVAVCTWFDYDRGQAVRKALSEASVIVELTREQIDQRIAEIKAACEALEVEAAAKAEERAQKRRSDKESTKSAGNAGKEEKDMAQAKLAEVPQYSRPCLLNTVDSKCHPDNFGEVVKALVKASRGSQGFANIIEIDKIIGEHTDLDLEGKLQYRTFLLNVGIMLEQFDEHIDVVRYWIDADMVEDVVLKMAMNEPAFEPSAEDVAKRVAEFVEKNGGAPIFSRPKADSVPPVVRRRGGGGALRSVQPAEPEPAPVAPAAAASEEPVQSAPVASGTGTLRQHSEARLRAQLAAIVESNADYQALTARAEELQAQRVAKVATSGELAAQKEAADAALASARQMLAEAEASVSSADAAVATLDAEFAALDLVIGNVSSEIEDLQLTPEQEAKKAKLELLLTPDMLDLAYGSE